ncbi:Male sterility, NAD-binding,NAD(P)-binding domain [Cinara cedri]|uniref:Fatty acyl-CoA reductase n=1 Tax=Cinara cedri TaxID=506608 RepID=A0A5E4N341_9HEMI|nr:Male sterility, NAD-binding,NAD(P)-binding domain [Cinara cedri]
MPDTVDEPKSEIQQFFSGTNVFLTGATGIVGHVLVEKLLRKCYKNKLYLLIRPKKNKDPQNRLNEMFSDSLFKRLAENQPNFTKKVVVVSKIWLYGERAIFNTPL